MSALEEVQEQGYWSTLLDRPVWIRNQPGTPKAKEDCQPFTFTLAEREPAPEGATYDPDSNIYRFEDGRFGHGRLPDTTTQAKLLPKLNKALNGKNVGSTRRTFGCRIPSDEMVRRYRSGWMS